ncbi:transmembrane protein adipocyte-associated 1 homolog isoform X1 [Trichogramma pretiosum]|uniref:transmembrane protein adipocyte-associated 1 homolog isoform X1 n=1 Tax=Trichogramma pretiosum TaxID=7493 RepID=UPI0006C96802|nr:transmembrane protein adipocyte-associated 1 homolog isoform X1 [Trichogramma pretiosum]XP_014234531.1 transmembrane protein adipocyte-associated 1 homolog isoform X1 [Trichogramma pretiosum]XP_023319342.1 transmembrane protein adipocyte-associated 1 homolog isoform X1 [Trichogramma pretiosum]XP_023319343.1 transmembrane protein adipocyte-associated 1 homolog isoform X1 [Trichogramma pretiosum]
MYGDGEMEVSEGWRQVRDISTTTDPSISYAGEDEDHFCKLILYKEIKDSRVRIWDIIILIPNLLFLLFIAIRFNRARLKLRATSSPIYLAFYGLVICSVVISVIRCIVAMTVNATASIGGTTDKVLWVTVRFFLLSTEMSVVIFCLAFGNLDSRSSIRRVLLATSFIALVFTITQGTLELVLPDDTFHIPSRDLYVYGHGGMLFWFCSSIVFSMIYLFILILPYTRLRERLTLPNRKGFYVYIGLLAALDLIQSIGAGLLNYTQNPAGLCVVDLTAAVYLTLFIPLVCHTFLSEFFGVTHPTLMFSYKPQMDDAMEEDTVSLPHQQSFSSLKTDSDYIYQVHTPSFHVPLFQSQRMPNIGTKFPTNKLRNSSSHSILFYHDYSAKRGFRARLRPSSASGQTSAPDLSRLRNASDDELASASKLLLSPVAVNKYVLESRDDRSKHNVYPDGNQSDSNLETSKRVAEIDVEVLTMSKRFGDTASESSSQSETL